MVFLFNRTSFLLYYRELRFKWQVRCVYHLSFHLFIEAFKAKEDVLEWNSCMLNLMLLPQKYVH